MSNYRKSIRVNGKCIQSPRFDRKADADEWYRQMKESKNFSKQGLKSPHTDVPTFGEWAIDWMHDRIANYPQATWASDEQRLRHYLLPKLIDLPLNEITPGMLKELILKSQITKIDPDNPDLRIAVRPTSFPLKMRIKSLASMLFRSAMERPDGPPLIEFNPARDMKLNTGRRQKVKSPTICLTEDSDCDNYLKIAKTLAGEKAMNDIFVFSAMYLMTGPRKSEVTALQWSEVSFDHDEIRFSHIIEQISNSRKTRTKGGEAVARVVPMPAQLKEILRAHKAASAFNGPSDFVVCDREGNFLTADWVSAINEVIRARLGRHVTTQGLRHSYGRKFITDGGNLKVLQQILGHASIKTTEIYATLSQNQLKKSKDIVSYNLED